MNIARWAWLLITLIVGAAAWAQQPTPNIEILRGVVYRTIDGTDLALDLYQPAGPTAPMPMILALHGGAWVSGERTDLRPLYELLAQEGYAVAAIDYRLAPRWIFPAPLEDARAAVDWLRAHADQYRVDPQRFFVFGISAGGQLAGLLGAQPETSGQFAGVILLAAPTDLTVKAPNRSAQRTVQQYLGAEQAAAPALYAAASPITHVSPDDPPFLIMHGQADRYVPPAQSISMADALRAHGVPVTLLLLPKIGHEMPAYSSAAGHTALAAMRNFLLNPRAAAGQEKIARKFAERA